MRTGAGDHNPERVSLRRWPRRFAVRCVGGLVRATGARSARRLLSLVALCACALSLVWSSPGTAEAKTITQIIDASGDGGGNVRMARRGPVGPLDFPSLRGPVGCKVDT